MYLAVRVALDPSCAPYLITYQRIITSANSNHPLHAWINYDMKFRTKAASEPTLRWDIRELDLWLECFPGTPVQTTRWPCSHCGSTTHFPSNCPFRPPTSRTPGGPQPTPANSQQRIDSPQTSVCRDFNRNKCYQDNCKFLHLCEICARPHPTRNCFAKGAY